MSRDLLIERTQKLDKLYAACKDLLRNRQGSKTDYATGSGKPLHTISFHADAVERFRKAVEEGIEGWTELDPAPTSIPERPIDLADLLDRPVPQYTKHYPVDNDQRTYCRECLTTLTNVEELRSECPGRRS